MRKKAINTIKRNYILIIILVLAFAVRAYGIYFDFPGTKYIHDETYEISYIVKALSEGTIYPDVILQYSFFSALLYLPFVLLKLVFIALREGLFSSAELKEYMILYGLGELMVITRWLSVLFGTGAVYLSYLIGRLIWSKRTGLVVAAGFAFSFVPVFLSHWGRRHMMMAFFILLALYFILRFEREKKISWFYYSNLSAALAIGAHYLGLNAVIFPLAAYLMNRNKIGLKDIGNNILIYIASFALFYLANWQGLAWMVQANISGHYGQGSAASLSSVGAFERFYYLFRDLFLVSPLILALGLAGLARIKGFWQNKLTRYLIFGLGFNYLVMILLVASPRNTRWLIVMAGYLTIIAYGVWGNFILQKIKRPALAGLAVVLLIMPGAAASVKYGYLLNSNTRIEAQAWIKGDLGPREKIYSFDYIVELPLSAAAAEWQANENKVKSAKNDHIIAGRDRLSGYGYELFYDFGNQRYRGLGGPDTKYVLISFYDTAEKDIIFNKLADDRSLIFVQGFYPSEYGLVAGDLVNNPNDFWTIMRLKRSGPYVEIYKIIKL